MTAPHSYIAAGSPAYRRINLALFLAGFATFSLLYCTQPLLPVLARDFAVSPAVSSLALSLTTAVLAFAVVLAGPLSDAAGRRGLMAFSITAASSCRRCRREFRKGITDATHDDDSLLGIDPQNGP